MNTHPQTGELKTLLADANNIAIFGHQNVDGDAIGSCLGLGTILENQGKTVSYRTTKEPNPSFGFLEGVAKFKTNFDFHPHYDLIIFCDTANPEQLLREFRVGHEAYFQKMPTLVIDHHVSNTLYAETNIVDDSISSACELVAELIHEIDPSWITPEVATYLFLGLSTDTGHFIYEKDSKRTFDIARFLMEAGANKKLIVDSLYRSTTLKGTQFLGLLISRIKKEERVIWTYYRREELSEYGVDKEKADSVLGIMTRIKHDGVFALVKVHNHESPAYLKASLRSKEGIDVSELASIFGGGGHRAAAGLKHDISDDWEKDLAGFVEMLK